MMNPYHYLRPLLFRLDPERAHNRILALLARMPALMPRYHGGKPVELMGLTFPNRLGLAAGLREPFQSFWEQVFARAARKGLIRRIVNTP